MQCFIVLFTGCAGPFTCCKEQCNMPSCYTTSPGLRIYTQSCQMIIGLLIKPKQQRDSLVNFSVRAIKDNPAPSMNSSQWQRESVAH